MTTTSELSSLSLSEAAALIKSREVSPVELTDSCIERAERLDDTLNVYITRTFDTARVEAKQAEADIAAGNYRGALHGVPFAIKDIYDTAGVRTTMASRVFENNVPAEDAETVARLKRAGVVLLGKLTLHEVAMGGTNVNENFPTSRNPWDTTRITGGSSGGSAAAIAAGLCYGSLGTDTRGSIRIPAALCNITGMKGTYGRVSIRGITPLSWSLDHSGPMARSAEDCARILQAIAGFDEKDPTTVETPVPDYVAALRTDLKGVRVGVARNFFFDDGVVQPEIKAAVYAARDVLKGLGAEIKDVDVPGALEFTESGAFFADSTAFHEPFMKQHPELYGSSIRTRLADTSVSGVDYSRARYKQFELKHGMRLLFRDIDLLLTPTSAILAPTIEESTPGPAGPSGVPPAATTVLARATSPFNVCGMPTISMPAGFVDGLPVGAQLTGRWWEEGLVLGAAHAYQQATDWHKRTPPVD